MSSRANHLSNFSGSGGDVLLLYLVIILCGGAEPFLRTADEARRTMDVRR